MADSIERIADGLTGLAAVIRKHGTCAPAALDEIATRLRALSPAGGDVWEVEAGGSAEHPQYWLHRNGRAFFNFGYGEDAELLAKSMARALNRLTASTKQSPAWGDWVMVPREPTKEMRAAGERERISRPTNMNPYHVWAAMLAASPQQEPGVDEAKSVAERLIAWMIDISESVEDGDFTEEGHRKCVQLAHDAIRQNEWFFGGRPKPTPADESGVELRLFDSQWVSIVNHANCYAGWAMEEAIAHAVKLTEQAMAKNVRDGKFPQKEPSGQTLAGAGVSLPELPEPAGHSGIPAFSEFYTADQMREYARRAREVG